jgi:hypothetical protein
MGHAFTCLSLILVQAGEPPPAHVHAQWMDYQKGQAAKTEALGQQLAGRPAADGDIEDVRRMASAGAPGHEAQLQRRELDAGQPSVDGGP